MILKKLLLSTISVASLVLSLASCTISSKRGLAQKRNENMGNAWLEKRTFLKGTNLIK